MSVNDPYDDNLQGILDEDADELNDNCSLSDQDNLDDLGDFLDIKIDRGEDEKEEDEELDGSSSDKMKTETDDDELEGEEQD